MIMNYYPYHIFAFFRTINLKNMLIVECFRGLFKKYIATYPSTPVTYIFTYYFCHKKKKIFSVY